MMYERTLEYLEHQLSAERDHLHTINPQNSRTMAEKALGCEEALNDFARQRWPDYGLADIKFLSD